MIALLSTLSFLLTGLFLCVCVFLIRGWNAVKQPLVKSSGFSTRVTILIAARNEEEKIHLTIEDILAQDYPKHLTEIIIADDHSTDRTSQIISNYADRGVRLLQMNEDKPLNSYKKKAIAKAIDLSTGDLMVATDADCRMGNKWLSTIVGYFEMYNPVMISSPVSYFEEKSLFERMQSLEFYSLIATGGAFIGNGRASTCNGANLAYRKDIFYEVGGFKGIDDLASGDDELLLQKVAERYPGKIGFLKLYDAIVFTHAKPNLKEFLQQRRRWASKSVKYKDKKVVALVVGLWLFNVSVLLNFLAAFFSIHFLTVFAIQFVLMFLFELMLLYPVTSFFKRQKLISLLLISIPLYVIYFVYIGMIGNKGKYIWKDRMVR
ncbi:cellulose synthase/poly-beta-1,6-N-acetylglucosamine synthase-like glycosyltransferase [Mucilaginibacter frigoritolerans]|uniref:Cellulose synthase/poly-beta-1,6-N-acetylglucosamine synthase-like glycosyltransferase n=1 Tax=Mucilaginibacter frigoritolerans TaxID=652788 RepID=A0A562U919_9SPHI|nr:glycosyltransferase [Mucilaginibacter frigoritolerans]TWJ02303.1 cellulose synthase/poly-beta-1,6-N-acetylglucosamine synthase-like glycosyltransferase [Mucilaginibacter frigoritolerans]